MIKKILLGLSAILGLLLTFGSEGAYQSNFTFGSEGKTITLSMVNWDTEIASTNVIATVLEDAGYNVEITPVDVSIMFSSVANGEADATVGSWLPVTHASFYEEYQEDFIDLGPNLEGALIGLVVPTYMEDVNSIEDLSDEANQTITGIEPGAGVVMTTETAMETYSNLSDWTLQTSSTGAMTTALGQAYENQEEIVVTGWSPHWKFQTYDLKYLEDPEGVYGGEETLNTLVREGLEEDMPEAYQILDNFEWGLEDMEAVMLDISGGMEPADAARKWVDENQDKVNKWING